MTTDNPTNQKTFFEQKAEVDAILAEANRSTDDDDVVIDISDLIFEDDLVDLDSDDPLGLGDDGPLSLDGEQPDWFQMWTDANGLAARLIHERDALAVENRLLRAMLGKTADEKIEE